MSTYDIGLIGLAVMGENLVLNMENHGFSVAVFNRTVSKVDRFMENRAAGKNIKGCHSIEELTASLKRPRKIMLMVKAGQAVDDFIELVLPHLEKGDIIIDGGNSHFPDSIRRTAYLEEKGMLFIGTGVSGGEEGALKGPSIMPGGSAEAWPHVKGIFQGIAAKVEDGSPCCEWVGNDGAGHFVKMVHNGIEYGDMQMICEAYTLMENLLGMTPDEMHRIFAEWNKGELDSYLIEITADILAKKDIETGKPMVHVILDTAGQKGTGKWTSQAALDLGIPAQTVAEAVFARFMSAIKEERVAASKVLKGPESPFVGDKKAFVEMVRKALYASKICSYAQGYQLMRTAAEEYGWDLKFGDIARSNTRSTSIRVFPICFSMTISKRPSRTVRRRGVQSSPGPLRWVFRFRHSAVRWPTTTATGAEFCPPTCSRRSGTISERTRMSGSTSRGVNFSIQSGLRIDDGYRYW
jgi:6-phosphogluconate dehydrogenase